VHVPRRTTRTEEIMAALNIELQPGDIQTLMQATSEADPAVSLGPGNSLYSPTGAFRLTFQGNGNAVLQLVVDSALPPLDGAPTSPESLDWAQFWETDTAGTGASRISMQADGNLVIYNPTGRAIWASNTAGHVFASLIMQDDGNLVIYEQNSITPIWATNTSVYGSPGASRTVHGSG
jgi:hypothetical protein